MKNFILRHSFLLAFITCLIATVVISIQKIDIRSANKKERDYQSEWCREHGGKMEVVLKDRTRIDCLTATHAIEFDFAKKWAEAPFQALHYARMTGKKPGVVIICRKQGDLKKLDRLRLNLEFYRIDVRVWSMGCE